MKSFAVKTLMVAALAGVGMAANAGILKISEAAFTAQAGLITFSEKALGTVNPTYTPANYGGGAGAPTVTFDGYFLGQSLGAGCGGAATGCVVGTPTIGQQLALDPLAPNTSIVNDSAAPNSPVLSGSPTFNGPIAILFSEDLAGVGLDAGYFNAIGGTAISAFDRMGNLLGRVANTTCGSEFTPGNPACTPGGGIEFLGLVTDDGSEKIAGLLFSLVGAEPAGFAIDSLRFGRSGQVVVPGVPEPGSLALVGLALAGLGLARRRKA